MTQEQIDAYADLTTDRNPLHVDQEFAAQSRFGGTIAHGFLMLAGVLDLLPDAPAPLMMECRFLSPVRPGEEPHAAWVDAGTDAGADTEADAGTARASGQFMVRVGDRVTAQGTFRSLAGADIDGQG